MKRCLPLVAALLAVTGACGGRLVPSMSATGGDAAFQRVLDRIGDDGTIDRDTALQAFALAFTPPPGVTTPPGPTDPILSGSGALRWVTAQLAELTPAQRRAVESAVPRPANTTAAMLPALTEQAQFETLVGEAWSYWSDTFPPSSRLHPIDRWSVTLNSGNHFAAGAYSYPVDARQQLAGPVDDCWIYFNPRVRSGTDAQKREAAYHEVFLCFEAQMVPNLAGFYAESSSGFGPAAWLIEGGAAYGMDLAMAALASPTPYGAAFWTTYFHTPLTPLFKRAYDAIGFFAYLAQNRIDVMARMPAAMRAIVGRGGSVAAAESFLAGTSLESSIPTSRTI
jgi:hypothetical protein